MMDKIINPNMIVLARKSRGLAQSQLAHKLGITQVAISKIESGLCRASNDLFDRLAQQLKYPKRFFFQPGYIYPPATPFQRKKMALPKRMQSQLEALANIQRNHISQLLAAVEFEFVNNDILYLDVDEYNGKPEEVARAIRSYWRLPKGPIGNLTKVLESAGIIILQCDFRTSLLDGFTLITDNAPPIMFINKNIPCDRMRFTCAHELGHIVMHKVQHPSIEDEANKFASEFLMPADEIKASLGQLTINKLATLKPYWKVSMGALLMRAKSLRKINYNQYRYLWTQMSKLGYKQREPSQLDVPAEKPSLIQKTLSLHLNDLNYSVPELCKALLISEEDFIDWYSDMLPQSGHSTPKFKIIK